MSHVSKHNDSTKGIKTLTKFKVGDKVRAMRGNYTVGTYIVPGETYTIRHIRGEKYVKLVEITQEHTYDVERFDPVDEMDKHAIDTQVGGDHYKRMGIQPLEAVYQNFGYMGLKASIYTKVMKYFRTKDNEVEDIKKAIHAMQILLEKAEAEVEASKR